jgi:hypothetical protein
MTFSCGERFWHFKKLIHELLKFFDLNVSFLPNMFTCYHLLHDLFRFQIEFNVQRLITTIFWVLQLPFMTKY